MERRGITQKVADSNLSLIIMLRSPSEYSSKALINVSLLAPVWGHRFGNYSQRSYLSNKDNFVRVLLLGSLCLYLTKELTYFGPVTKGLLLTTHCIPGRLLWPPAFSSTKKQESHLLETDSDRLPPFPGILHCKPLWGDNSVWVPRPGDYLTTEGRCGSQS